MYYCGNLFTMPNDLMIHTGNKKKITKDIFASYFDDVQIDDIHYSMHIRHGVGKYARF